MNEDPSALACRWGDRAGGAGFRFNEGLKVYLHRPAVDLRMSINGLALLVEQSLGLNPFAECGCIRRCRSLWKMGGETSALINSPTKRAAVE